MAARERERYPMVRLRYIDSALRDRQTSVQDELKPMVSEVAGFLLRDAKDRVEIARELFVDGNYVEVRGTLSVPRCALVGKVRRVRA